MRKNRKICLLIIVFFVASYVVDFYLIEPKEQKINNSKIAFYYIDENENEVRTDTIPEGYVFKEAACTNGATVTWNSETRKVQLKTKSATSCKVYFELLSNYTVVVRYINDDYYNANGMLWVNSHNTKVLPKFVAVPSTTTTTIYRENTQECYGENVSYCDKSYNVDLGETLNLTFTYYSGGHCYEEYTVEIDNINSNANCVATNYVELTKESGTITGAIFKPIIVCDNIETDDYSFKNISCVSGGANN